MPQRIDFTLLSGVLFQSANVAVVVVVAKRQEPIKKELLHLTVKRTKPAKEKLYFELVDRGYKTVELPSSIVGEYVLHLAHATQVVNPQEFTLRKRTIKKCSRLVSKVMYSEPARSILSDDSLDK